MTDREFLISKGWRCIADGKGKYMQCNYWDHADHQPLRHGAFLQREAVAHQKYVDKHGMCTCIPKDGGNLR